MQAAPVRACRLFDRRPTVARPAPDLRRHFAIEEDDVTSRSPRRQPALASPPRAAAAPSRVAALAVLAALLVLAAVPSRAQLERDRPRPPGAPDSVTVFTRLAAAGTAKEHPGFDYLIVLDETVNKVVESGVTYTDQHVVTKILTEDGAKARSALEWPYDPRSSFVEVARVDILRDGQRLPVDVSQVKDLPAPQAAIYWADRLKVLQLPRLRVGDGVEVVAMRKGYNYALLAAAPAVPAGGPAACEGDAAASAAASAAKAAAGGTPPADGTAYDRIRGADDDRYIPPMRGEYFDIVVMQADVPIEEKRYTVILPAAKRLISQEYNGALYTRTDYTADETRTTWWLKDVPALPHEPRQPGAQDLSPKVVLTTAPSWEAKSQWFFDVNRNQFEVTDAIRAHVDEVLAAAGLTRKSDPLQVAKALNHWVAQNIRYSGQTMGEGEGFTLHPSDVLFEYRSGVCKDIASMSITLLRAAGLQTYPAMTMAGSRIEDLPADQFNHCVVAWERAPGDFVMLDPTWVPFNNDIWSKLETEQQYVIGHPDGVALKEIRYSPPEESPLLVTNTATLSADGTLTGTLRLEGKGALDGRLRGFVSGVQKRALTPALARLLGRAGAAVRVGKVAHRAPDDFTGDMWLTAEYEIPRWALRVGDALELRPAAANAVKEHGGLFRAGATDWAEERQTDILLYNTQRLEIEERIRLPGGYDLADPPAYAAVAETLAAFTGKAAQEGRTLQLSARVDVKRRQIPPAQYAGFRKAIAALDDFAGRPIRVVKGGAR